MLDTCNKFLVGTNVGGGIRVVNLPALMQPISHEDALNLAAYLFVTSRKSREEFLELVTAVENT